MYRTTATPLLLLSLAFPCMAAEKVVTVSAVDCGLAGDGKTDDGPAIERMLQMAAAGPARLMFPKGKTIRVIKAPERYVFRFDRVKDITIDGGGCTFLLSPDVRFMNLRNSRNVVVRNLNIDFSPLPFVDGTIVAVDAKNRCIDVAPLDRSRPLPLGGPMKQDGEQAFFGMLWYDGPYGTLSSHYWIAKMKKGPGPGIVRAYNDNSFKRFRDIVPGRWTISLPVPGIAHRYGPGACVEIFDNDTVTFENVELWSAPWFGFRVFRNSGAVTFRNVHIRPKPGSGRLTSTWRDGFHVKGNRGKLLWDGCVITATNDDAFNISTHASNVRNVISKTEIVVQQKFPLNYMPWRVGNTLVAADFEKRTLLGSSKIVRVTESKEKKTINGKPRAMPVTLELEKPIAGLANRSMVWEKQSANPDTTLRNCTIEKSCRFQSPVTLEKCKVTAFLWFYAAWPEGPFPSDVVIRDCELRRGRGNAQNAVTFAGCAKGTTAPSAVRRVIVKRNKIWGGFRIQGVDEVTMTDNKFMEK